MNNEKWIDDLRKSVQGHSSTPPDNLWAGISAGISGATQKPTPKRQAINPRWTWVGIAAAFALLMGIGILWTNSREEALDPIIITATNTTETNQPNTILQPAEEVADASTPSVEVAPQRRQNLKRYADVTSSSEEKTLKIKNKSTTEIPSEALSEGHSITEPTTTKQEKEEAISLQKDGEVDATKDSFKNQVVDSGRNKAFVRPLARTKRTGKMQMSFSGSGANTDVTTPNQTEMLFSSLEERGEEPSKAYKSTALPIDELLETTSTSRHHSRPFTLGLHVRGDVWGKLGLEGGLVYHRLYSTFESPARSSGLNGNQTLEYIGIPLGLTYPLWERSNLSLFVSAGGQLAINIKRSVEIDNIEEVHLLDNHNKFAHTLDKAQWSINAGIGLQYNLLSRVGLFVQPQINYYLNNGSSVETFYKTTPLNVSINAGIKIDVGRLTRR